jgi:HK97 family phage prohead protease
MTSTTTRPTAALAMTGLRMDPDKPGRITGTATKFDQVVDRGEGLGLEIAPGAFAAAAKDPGRVKILWQHDIESPIGHLTALTRVGDRLDVDGRISTSAAVPRAAEALALLRDGVIDELSVGFEWLQWVEREADGRHIFRVERARLLEVSVVTFGALERDATVKTVNSANWPQVRRPHPDAAAVRARMLAATH